MSTLNDEENIDSRPPEILDEKSAGDSVLSRSKEWSYDNFIQWKNGTDDQSFSENVFLDYFNELAKKCKPSTLLCNYSMLKSTVMTKHGIDIKPYSKLSAFLKTNIDGYVSPKTKTLTLNEVDRFLKEAPDNIYLAMKVALIFGITGACGSQDLNNITTKDIQNHGKMLLIKIINTKNKLPRKFTISGPFYEVVKKYEALRTANAKDGRFFQNYQKGKCTCQHIGINKFGAMPKKIAKFLDLLDAESYTGHCFRATSAALLADSVSLKRYYRRQQTKTMAKSLEDNSIRNRTNKTKGIEPDSKKIYGKIPEFEFVTVPSTYSNKNNSQVPSTSLEKLFVL